MSGTPPSGNVQLGTMIGLLQQLVRELAPRGRQSTPITFDSANQIVGPIRTQGRINQFLVCLQAGTLDVYFNNVVIDPASPFNRPIADMQFGGPVGNPIPIPYYGDSNSYITFAVAEGSVPVKGKVYISYY